MAIQSDTELKNYFKTGDSPTEGQFIDLIDSKLLKTGASAVKVNTISEETTNNGVKIETVKFQDNLIAQGADQTQGYVMRMYNIGIWNMNRSVTGVSSTTVVLESALKNPESVSVVILRDDGFFTRSIENQGGGYWNTDSSGDISITAESSGIFDNANYNGSTNRGFVVVTKWTTLTV